MTDQMTLDGDYVSTNRTKMIRDLFETHGGELSTYAFAELCIAEGLYTEDELSKASIRWVQGSVRRVLKRPDESGLPFAGETTERDESGSPLWRQRKLWLYEDYELNIHTHLTNRDENHRAAVALTRECAARFGRCPFIPSLEEAA